MSPKLSREDLNLVIRPFFNKLRKVYRGYWPTFVIHQKDHTTLLEHLHPYLDFNSRRGGNSFSRKEFIEVLEKILEHDAETVVYTSRNGRKAPATRIMDPLLLNRYQADYFNLMLCALTDLVEEDFYLAEMFQKDSSPEKSLETALEDSTPEEDFLQNIPAPITVTEKVPLAAKEEILPPSTTEITLKVKGINEETVALEEDLDYYLSPETAPFLDNGNMLSLLEFPLESEVVSGGAKVLEEAKEVVKEKALVVYETRMKEYSQMALLNNQTREYLAAKAAARVVAEEAPPQDYKELVDQFLEALESKVGKDVLLQAMAGYKQRVEIRDEIEKILPPSSEWGLERRLSSGTLRYLPTESREISESRSTSEFRGRDKLYKICDNLRLRYGIKEEVTSGLASILSQVLSSSPSTEEEARERKENLKVQVDHTYNAVLAAPLSEIPKRAVILAKVFTTVFQSWSEYVEHAFFELYKDAELHYNGLQPDLGGMAPNLDIHSIYERLERDPQYLAAQGKAQSLSSIRSHLAEMRARTRAV